MADLQPRDPGGIGMTARLASLFTDHPASVDESYFGHMAFAAWFVVAICSWPPVPRLFTLSCPSCSNFTASGIIRELYERTHNRGR